MRVVIRGGGDIATGIALRLIRSGMEVVLCELANPTAIRRTVSFSECMRTGETAVEGITARRAHLSQVERLLAQNIVPVLEDPSAGSLPGLHADALVDAILAKVNLGTRLDMAPVVVGVGPGFTAGEDCHAVVETMRGHTLGRVYYEGSALPNTNIPGLIGGFAGERVLRARRTGCFISFWRSAPRWRPGTWLARWGTPPWSVRSAASSGASSLTAPRSIRA